MEAQTERKKLNIRIQGRVEWLRKNDSGEAIYSNLALAQTFKVSEQTIISWRHRGLIPGKQVAPGVWEYTMGDVLDSLEKYCG